MLIPPTYSLTPKISQLLSSIEASKAVIDAIPIPIEIETNIRRRSSLKSSLFSARIEGNTLTLDDLPRASSKDQKRIEVFNILKALNSIQQKSAKDLSVNGILTLHQMVMQGLIDRQELGHLRSDVSAIFNSAGIAIYLPPPPSQVLPLMNKLLQFLNSSKEPSTPIRACLVHFIFEKIHPFLDGNGRVGRLIMQSALAKGGYGMKGLLALEEQLDQNRSGYYQALEAVERDVTQYLEFMLEAMAKAAQEAKNQVLQKEQIEPEDYLLPRRSEILNIIKDLKLVSFDQIRRRFLMVNERTLRYDLKRLQDAGFIKKRGATKGVYYEPTKNSTTSPS